MRRGPVESRAGCRPCEDGKEWGMKHRCLITLQTTLEQTELALRIYFKTLMALPYVWEPSQCEGTLEMSTHMMAHKGKQLFFPSRPQTEARRRHVSLPLEPPRRGWVKKAATTPEPGGQEALTTCMDGSRFNQTGCAQDGETKPKPVELVRPVCQRGESATHLPL